MAGEARQQGSCCGVQNVCLAAAASRARGPCAAAGEGSAAPVLATGRARPDAREQGKGPSDGPPAAGALRPGSARGTVLDTALPHPARRAQGVAAHDHGLPGKLQPLMPKRLVGFLEKDC